MFRTSDITESDSGRLVKMTRTLCWSWEQTASWLLMKSPSVKRVWRSSLVSGRMLVELLIKETALWRLEDRAESWLRNIEPRNQRD